MQCLHCFDLKPHSIILYLTFALRLGKANKKECEQDMWSIKFVFHCINDWINCCEEMKDHLGHSGIISNVVLLHLNLIQAFPVVDEV